jgi:hypothetical protein
MVRLSEVAKASAVHENTLRKYVLLFIEKLDFTIDELVNIYVNTESYKVKMKVLEKLIEKLKNDSECPPEVIKNLRKH